MDLRYHKAISEQRMEWHPSEVAGWHTNERAHKNTCNLPMYCTPPDGLAANRFLSCAIPGVETVTPPCPLTPLLLFPTSAPRHFFPLSLSDNALLSANKTTTTVFGLLTRTTRPRWQEGQLSTPHRHSLDEHFSGENGGHSEIGVIDGSHPLRVHTIVRLHGAKGKTNRGSSER